MKGVEAPDHGQSMVDRRRLVPLAEVGFAGARVQTARRGTAGADSLAVRVLGRAEMENVVPDMLALRSLPVNVRAFQEPVPVQETEHVGLERGRTAVRGEQLEQVLGNGFDSRAARAEQEVRRAAAASSFNNPVLAGSILRLASHDRSDTSSGRLNDVLGKIG
jgi:hypothetical protein